MARADTRTLLPLDRFTQIVSYSPILFNQVYLSDLQPASSCSDPILQYTWQPQGGGRPGREEIAQAIRQAEDMIESALKFPPAPKWVVDDRVPYPPGAGVPSNWLYIVPSRTPRGQAIAVRASNFHVIAGGLEKWSLIDEGAAIVYTDDDGDGYFETATVTVTTTVTDVNEVAVVYPGQTEYASWEIRPVKVSISGGTATITFSRHQVVKPDLLEALNASGVDGSVDANFLTVVDVYRHYNDPSQMATLEWEGCNCADSCNICSISAQSACITVRDGKRGLVALSPGDWDAENEEYDCVCLSIGRRPDRVRLWYRAGYVDRSLARPLTSMAPQLERAITFLALSYLDREWLACEQIRNLQAHWRADLAVRTATQAQSTSYTLSRGLLDNPFGTTRAAIYAWRAVQPLIVGEAVLGK